MIRRTVLKALLSTLNRYFCTQQVNNTKMFKVNNIRAGFGIPPRGVVKVHLFFTDNKHVTCFRLKGPNLMCYCFIPYTSLNLGFFEFLRNED